MRSSHTFKTYNTLSEQHADPDSVLVGLSSHFLSAVEGDEHAGTATSSSEHMHTIQSTEPSQLFGLANQALYRGRNNQTIQTITTTTLMSTPRKCNTGISYPGFPFQGGDGSM